MPSIMMSSIMGVESYPYDSSRPLSMTYNIYTVPHSLRKTAVIDGMNEEHKQAAWLLYVYNIIA